MANFVIFRRVLQKKLTTNKHAFNGGWYCVCNIFINMYPRSPGFKTSGSQCFVFAYATLGPSFLTAEMAMIYRLCTIVSYVGKYDGEETKRCVTVTLSRLIGVAPLGECVIPKRH